nr:hypothetical protein [Tanacetum cinerariifolium]
ESHETFQCQPDNQNVDFSGSDQIQTPQYPDDNPPSPEIKTGSGNTTHANYSLPEYDSFCFKIEPDQERVINLVENDNSDSSNDPLLEEADLFLDDNPIPPGIENFADDPEGDIREEIAVVMNDKDKFDDDYQIFMFDKVFSLLSAESEDTIFDP